MSIFTRNDSVLLKKLIQSNNEDLIIYRAYQDVMSVSDNPNQDFIKCIEDISDLSNYQYNYDYLTKEAKILNIYRRDMQQLCDMVCAMLGDKLHDLCIKPIYVPSHNYEKYCVYPNSDLIMYTIKSVDIDIIAKVDFDGNAYKTIECRLEKTPYYELYATLLELTKK